jgi:hypothetical protein
MCTASSRAVWTPSLDTEAGKVAYQKNDHLLGLLGLGTAMEPRA